MTETLLVLVAEYGAVALMVVTFLSCLALPVPASLAMLTAGGFVAAGDLSLPETAAAALAGALAGDHLGYVLGRWLGTPGLARIAANPARGAALRRVTADLSAHGIPLVFFSRWLASPLGPYVNVAAGATRYSWPRFAAAEAAGEIVWVTIYVGLGAAFAGRIAELADLMGNFSGLVAALAVAAGAGLWLVRSVRHRRAG